MFLKNVCGIIKPQAVNSLLIYYNIKVEDNNFNLLMTPN